MTGATRVFAERVLVVGYGAITRCGGTFQNLRLTHTFVTLWRLVVLLAKPTTPSTQRLPPYTYQVWAHSRSLAATEEVEVSFFSCRYLDVSVPCVPFRNLCIQLRIIRRHRMAFPHSEISGSMPGWRLPGAFRSRPTSFFGYRCQNIHHAPFVA